MTDRTPPPIAQGIRARLEAISRAESPSAAARAAGLVEASVLVPLFARPDERRLRTWLLRRTETLRAHRGQVALPGGKREPLDPDAIATALREAEEEVGLDVRKVEVLGVLEDAVTRTGYVITPVVAWVDHEFEPVSRESEVARTFSVPMSRFEQAATAVVGADAAGGTAIPGVRAYLEAGEVIWGATAAILRALAIRIAPSELESLYL